MRAPAEAVPDIFVASQLLLHVCPLLVKRDAWLVQTVQHLHQGIPASNSMLLQPCPSCLELRLSVRYCLYWLNDCLLDCLLSLCEALLCLPGFSEQTMSHVYHQVCSSMGNDPEGLCQPLQSRPGQISARQQQQQPCDQTRSMQRAGLVFTKPTKTAAGVW